MFGRKAFSDVLKGVASTNFSGGKPSDSHFSILLLLDTILAHWLVLETSKDTQVDPGCERDVNLTWT